MSVNYSSIHVSKDLSNIDDLLESFDLSINQSIKMVIDHYNNNNNDGKSFISLWGSNGPMLSDINCLNNMKSNINAHRYYICNGCKILNQLNITTPGQSYIIGFGNIQGHKVFLKSRNMVATDTSISHDGNKLNMMLEKNVGSCGLYTMPNTMVGFDEFTNNIVISNILSQNNKWASNIHFSYICNNTGYVLTNTQKPLTEYIEKYPDQAHNIFRQLISFYKKCKADKQHFTHGNPKLSALMIHETVEGPVLKIVNFYRSSLSYTTGGKTIRIHNNDNDIPNMYTLSSTIKFNNINKSYKILYNNRSLINKLHKVGVPIFNESYDIYYFISYLSTIKIFYDYFVKSLIFETIFEANDSASFISKHHSDNAAEALIDINLYCDVLDRI